MKQIFIEIESYSKIASCPEFHTILTLGRMINSIRFAQHAALDNDKLESQPMVRQSLNSFLFQCSMIYEVDKWADHNYLKYKDYSSWQNGFQRIKSEKTFKDFKKSILSKLRNKFTFHFDSEYLGEAIGSYIPPGKSVVIISSETEAHGQHYYELSDILSLAYLFSANNDEDIKTGLKTMIKNSNTLSKSFIASCESLIGEIIQKNFSQGFILGQETN